MESKSLFIPEIINKLKEELASGDFEKLPDELEWGMDRNYAYKNILKISRLKAIYGYRLIISPLRDMSLFLNICAGAYDYDWNLLLYWIILKIKSNEGNGFNPLKDIPFNTEVKPYFYDERFMNDVKQVLILAK